MTFKYISLVFVLIICIANVGLSVTTSLIQSPEIKAEKLIKLSDQYLTKSNAVNLDIQTKNFLLEQSQSFLTQASLLTPYDSNLWKKIEDNNISDTLILANRTTR